MNSYYWQVVVPNINDAQRWDENSLAAVEAALPDHEIAGVTFVETDSPEKLSAMEAEELAKAWGHEIGSACADVRTTLQVQRLIVTTNGTFLDRAEAVSDVYND